MQYAIPMSDAIGRPTLWARQRDSFCFKASIRISSLASFSFAFVKNMLPFDISKTTWEKYCECHYKKGVTVPMWRLNLVNFFFVNLVHPRLRILEVTYRNPCAGDTSTKNYIQTTLWAVKTTTWPQSFCGSVFLSVISLLVMVSSRVARNVINTRQTKLSQATRRPIRGQQLQVGHRNLRVVTCRSETVQHLRVEACVYIWL